MATAIAPSPTVEALLRDLLSQSAIAPAELIEKVKAQHISDIEVRDALWRLLDRNEVYLTKDRRLALAA